MKNNKKKINYLLLFLGISVSLEALSVCKTFVYADESLTAFQQDIIQAKQKYQAISGKVNSMNLLLAQENVRSGASVTDFKNQMGGKTHTQNADAALLSKNEKIAKAKDKAKTLISDKPVKEIRLEAPSSIKMEKKKAAKPPKEKKEPVNKWFWETPSNKSATGLTDGEALYKVAVSDNKIALEEAIDIGLTNNVQLQALKKKVEVAESKLFEAKRALLPTVQGIYQTGGGKQPQTPPSSDDLSDSDWKKYHHYRIFRNENYKLNINQPLYYGGELFLTIKQADVNIKASKEEYEKARNELIHQIRSTYYGALKAEYNLQYQSELLKELEGLYQRSKKENEQKVVAEVDYLSVQSRYQQARFQYESAASDILSTVLLLQQTLRLKDTEKVPLDLELKFKKVDPNLDDVVVIAQKNNPDIRNKQFAYESAKLGLDVFKAKRRPHFDLRGSIGKLGEMLWDDYGHGDKKAAADDDLGYNHGVHQSFEMNKEWYLMLRGSMPIGPHSVEYQRVKHVYAPSLFSPTAGSEDWSNQYTFNFLDKLADITDEKQAQATVLQAQTDLEKIKDDVAGKIRDSFYSLKKSLLQVDSSVSKIKYQEKQNGIYRYMLSLQETSPTNLLDGLIEQAQNKFAFIGAVVEYQLAVSNLNLAIGDPYYFKT